jgi:sporulation protein YlmC with PRC-barrel domain
MAHLGTLRDFKFKGDVDDIRGADLYGRGSEKLGKVDDVVFDHAGGYIQYLVVDTGGWLRSNKFLVPADRVNVRGELGEAFTCDLSRDQIERFPEYKDSIIRNSSDWVAYEKRYRGSFEDSGGILHREGSDHLITPEASEMPAATGDAGIDATPTRLVDKFSPADPSSGKTRLRPAGTAARAEDSSLPGKGLIGEQAAWTERGVAARNRRATDRRPQGTVEQESAFGDYQRQPIPEFERNDPPAYRGDQDLNSRIGQRYASNRRLADFEENLRRNRVDITSSCRSCGEARSEDEEAA